MDDEVATASMYVADTESNQVIEALGGYCCSGILGPFAINGTATRVANQVNGYAGFSTGRRRVGRSNRVHSLCIGKWGHGIALDTG